MHTLKSYAKARFHDLQRKAKETISIVAVTIASNSLYHGAQIVHRVSMDFKRRLL
jgi:hypothetical protein